MSKLRVRAETLRGSFFYVPTLFVFLAIALAQLTLEIDISLSQRDLVFPTLLRATVDSARALLGTVAAATITFAGIAFSISLLMIQLVSSQFSPRVLYGFFRDSFSKRVMGVAVGTFTYALLVLRAVRDRVEQTDGLAITAEQAVIPTISVFVALLFGIVSILAIIAFINHSAHSMEVGEILRRITDDTRAQIRKLAPHEAGTTPPAPVEGPLHEGAPLVVRASVDGWVQGIDGDRMLPSAPPGGMIRVEVGMGTFVTHGTPLASIWPAPEDEDGAGRIVRGAITIGRYRTMQHDVGFGIRQIVDIGLRALSPGVNDPTTAYEAVVHLGPVMRELLLRDLPPRVIADDDSRRLFRPEEFSHADYVGLAFDQLRRASVTMLAVGESLLVVLAMLTREVTDAGMTERAKPLRRQAELVLEGMAASGALPADIASARKKAEELQLLG